MSKKPPKRPAEDYVRRQVDGDTESGSKKPRFDARNPSTLASEVPEEDAILELDEIGKGGIQTKRNAVKLDGYESDSSNENFDARAEAKAVNEKREKKKKKSKDEEDADMFADLEQDFEDGQDDEDISREGKRNKKNIKFMDENDIEGQVQSSKSGGHVSADFTLNRKGRVGKEQESSSSEDEEDEEEAGGQEAGDGPDVDEELGAGAKKRHAPKLDAFNMRNEAEEGRFDEHGNFVRNAADPMAVHDRWLEGSSKSEMKKAKEAHDKREEQRRQRDQESDAVSTSDALGALISRLQNGETVLEALARLGSGKTKKKPANKWKNKRKDIDMDIDDDTAAATNPEEDAAETKRKEMVEALTTAADQLMSRDQPEIYDTEKGLLIRQYKRETGEDWVDPPDQEDVNGQSKNGGPSEWQYRWSDARDGGDVHGPYDGETMKSWNEAGYFGDGVEFRQVGTNGWQRAVDFV